MKLNNYLQLTLLFLLGSITSTVYGSGHNIIVVDSVGKKDTVGLYFGNGSLGVDASLGEVNIFDTEWDSLEIRSIQRDSNSIGCLKKFSKISATNIDLKTDYRPVGMDWINPGSFIIKVKGAHYPLTLYITEETMYWVEIATIDSSSCSLIKNDLLLPYDDYNHMYTKIIPDSTESLFYVRYYQLVNIDRNVDSIKVAPNPIGVKLFLTSIPTECTSITITSINGKVMKAFSGIASQNSPISLDVEELKPGVYILNLMDREGNRLVTKTLVK